MKHVSKVLREARERQGLTQIEIARSFKYRTAQYVSNWERGIAAPPYDKLPKLLNMLHVPRARFTRAYLADRKRELQQWLK